MTMLFLKSTKTICLLALYLQASVSSVSADEYLRGNDDIKSTIDTGSYEIGLQDGFGIAKALIVPRVGPAVFISLPLQSRNQIPFKWVRVTPLISLATPLPTETSPLTPREHADPMGPLTLMNIDCAGIAVRGLVYLPIRILQAGPTYLVRINPADRTTSALTISQAAREVRSVTFQTTNNSIRVRFANQLDALVPLH
jgi:hypothetical protein